MKCTYCSGVNSIKKGKRKSVQQFYCKCCKKYFRERYIIFRIDRTREVFLVRLHREGVGTRSIARIMEVSHTCVMKTKLRLATQIPDTVLREGQIYQMDELATFIAWKERPKPKKGKRRKKQEWYVIHAIESNTGKHAGFVCGKRTKKNIGILTEKLLKSGAKRIYTDGLNIYPYLIPRKIHSVYEKCTNRIERLNLTMRTHIKRLSRKTLCFSRNAKMMEVDLKLYFGWRIILPYNLA